MGETDRSAAFERYFSDITQTVAALERLAEHYRSTRAGKRESDLLIDDVLPPADVTALMGDVEERAAKLRTYASYGFNIDKLIAKYDLNLKEQFILFSMIVRSLYEDGTAVALKRILELASVRGELYVTNYQYLAPTAPLIANGILAVTRDAANPEALPDFLRSQVSFADSRTLFVLLEQAPWNYLERAAETECRKRSERKFESIIERITPKEIVAELNRSVVGQTRAKRVLAVQAYLHYLRVKKSDAVPLRSNIMMIGPTGVGKTFLAKKLAEILAIPFTRADVTTLTETGYVGDDVEIVLYDLVREAGGDQALAEKGIVFLDEVDKIAKAETHQSTTGNPSDKAVQEALLSMLNGERIRVPETGDRRTMHSGEGLLMNTHNILFIFGGAFVGLDKIIADRMKGDTTLGFNASLTRNSEERDTLLKQVDMKDLEKFGMIPEFLGRIPIVVPLTKLTKSEMESILTTSPDSPLIKYAEFFRAMGKRLVISGDAVASIVDRAIAMDTGARALKSVVENIMVNVLYHYEDITGGSLKITKRLVAQALDEDMTAVPAGAVETKKMA
ncbi:MAG: AAA family ATPase [Spirochaetota bacterium]